MSEVWNSVAVFGSAKTIISFKALCIFPDNPALTVGQFGWDGCLCDIKIPTIQEGGLGQSTYETTVDNFQHFYSNSPREYRFSFDTNYKFPQETFKKLARCFPNLVFDCDCIGSMDEFMGYGFFNAPPGGENFSQNYRVPRNYWKKGPGFKRTPAAQAKYEACVRSLTS